MSNDKKIPTAAKAAPTVKAVPTVKAATVKDEPKKQVEQAESRNIILARRIKHASDLQAKLNLRELFEDSLDDLLECSKEVKENAKDNTLQNSGSSKIQIVDSSGRTVLSFSNIGLVLDSMEYVQKRISEKITAIDNDIVDLDF
jgi:hypothetical protein